MTDEIKESNKLYDTEQFNTRFFLRIDGEKYVTGMFVAINENEAEEYSSKHLTEISGEIYKSVGQDSQFINGSVVQGNPRIPILDIDAKRAILDARLRTASEHIQTLQDAVDLDMATDEEKNNLIEWKKYRVLLSRIDPANTDIESWPAAPAA